MQNNIVVIENVRCYEKDGIAYLKLEDVARGLGFVKIEKKGDIEYASIRWARIEQYFSEMGFDHKWAKDSFIPENIFYRLAMKAKNEVAERFQAKVADEIIPAIRKNGGYIVGQENMTPEQIVANALIVANNIIEAKNKQIEEMKPKALFADAVTASENSILIRELAKLLKQNGLDIGEKRLYKQLRQDGYICKGSTEPTQKAMELGLFERIIRTVQRADDLPLETVTTKVTTKGQLYFVNKYLGK